MEGMSNNGEFETGSRGRVYFVDCLTDEGWQLGGVGYPAGDALARANELREQHPGWLVEINSVERSAL